MSPLRPASFAAPLAALLLAACSGSTELADMNRHVDVRQAWDAPKATPDDFKFPVMRWGVFTLSREDWAPLALERAKEGADLDALFREGARLQRAGAHSVGDVRHICSNLPPEGQEIAPCKAPERGNGLGLSYVEPGSDRQVMAAFCCANPYIPRYQVLSRGKLVLIEYLEEPAE